MNFLSIKYLIYTSPEKEKSFQNSKYYPILVQLLLKVTGITSKNPSKN